MKQVEIQFAACKDQADRIQEIAENRSITLDRTACIKAPPAPPPPPPPPRSVTLKEPVSENFRSGTFSNSWSGTYSIPAGTLTESEKSPRGCYVSKGATFKHTMGTITPIAGICVPSDPSKPFVIFWRDHTMGSGEALNIGVQKFPQSLLANE